MPVRKLFTSESVTMGHPDKIADQISDAVLDAMLAEDPFSRVACETLVTTGMAIVAGEVTTSGYVDIPAVVRGVIRDIGYTDANMGFDYRTCAVLVALGQQSPDIARGVNETADHEQGAGDQGSMFGYACRETEELMPLPIMLAHQLVARLTVCRREKILPYLRPDGKAQVTVEYQDGEPRRVEAVVIAAQHEDAVDRERTLIPAIEKHVIGEVIPAHLLDARTKYHINPTGRFVIGGPQGDCGLTGRKIIVDTYGGKGSHGGGCFSGKDPTKVDRSAGYLARHIAKNVVAAGLAAECEVQLSYAIGVAEPVAVLVDTGGTCHPKLTEEKLGAIIREVFPLKPKAIIEYLNLRRPIFRKTAYHGHFGRREPEFTWEATHQAPRLRELAGL